MGRSTPRSTTRSTTGARTVRGVTSTRPHRRRRAGGRRQPRRAVRAVLGAARGPRPGIGVAARDLRAPVPDRAGRARRRRCRSRCGTRRRGSRRSTPARCSSSSGGCAGASTSGRAGWAPGSTSRPSSWAAPATAGGSTRPSGEPRRPSMCSGESPRAGMRARTVLARHGRVPCPFSAVNVDMIEPASVHTTE